MKIKFNSDDNLPLNKTIEISAMTIVARAVFHKNNKYYRQLFLDEWLHKLLNNIKMLHFDKIDVSKGTDVNKTSASKDCDICQCRYFLDFGFKFQQNDRNRCHDLIMMSMNFNDIAILNIKGSNYY